MLELEFFKFAKGNFVIYLDKYRKFYPKTDRMSPLHRSAGER